MDATWISPIRFELATDTRDDFRLTLEDACKATARRLILAPPVITHGVADMFSEVRFKMQDYTSLTAGARAFLFVAQTSAAAEKLRSKARLCDNTLRVNITPSMA